MDKISPRQGKETHTQRVGVPQGSALSPLLYSAYTNNIPRPTSGVQLALFADDTALYYKNRSKTTRSTILPLQRAIDELGVTFDRNLIFREHITLVRKTAHFYRARLGAMLGRKSKLSRRNKHTIYKMCIWTVMTHASPVFAYAAPTALNRLQTFFTSSSSQEGKKKETLVFAVDDQEKAECIADSTELQCSHTLPPHNIQYITLIEEEVHHKTSLDPLEDLSSVSLDEVQKLVKSLKAKKAPGLDGISVQIALFADDTTLYLRGQTERNICPHLQKAIEELARWFQIWRIEVNAEKSAAISFIRRKGRSPVVAAHSTPLHIYNAPILWKHTYKYLSITLDRNLHFRDHIKRDRKTAIFCQSRLKGMLVPLPTRTGARLCRIDIFYPFLVARGKQKKKRWCCDLACGLAFPSLLALLRFARQHSQPDRHQIYRRVSPHPGLPLFTSARFSLCGQRISCSVTAINDGQRFLSDFFIQPSFTRVQVRDGGLIFCPRSRRGYDPDGSGGNGLNH
ncbi:RNA-directed DNA polymerase from mobile element jockey [Eumeta japonica]|uniref:RNA-directed DNA polymerase from mobile element jockey n=1 Tax=Eumeta variegata TaxID=151549 RepID=A0A4C1U2G3_EUMVA|nr:RNA-directed DNA polymerase from mobile element jockey [Eumeta japonica]